MKENVLLEEKMENGHVVKIVSGVSAKVKLISHSTNMAETLAVITRGYKGIYSLEPTTEEEQQSLLKDLQNTKLGTPAEMIYFVFLVEDVTRAWTHQAVRTRIGASFVQESMRFMGAKNEYKILCTVKDPVQTELYAASAFYSIALYESLMRGGAEAQDARGILPTNILTRMFWGMGLSTLSRIYNQRICCNAQTDEWIPVIMQMRREIERVEPTVAALLTAPIDRGENCGFNASFDRPCVWRERTAKQREDMILGEE